MAADPEFPGECGFRLSGGGAPYQVGRLPGVQRLAPAFVDAGLFGQRDPFTLPFPDEGPLELGERPHHRQQERRHRGVLSGEGQVLLHEPDLHLLLGQPADDGAEVIEVPGQAVHALRLLGLDPGQARQLGVEAPTRTAHRKLASRHSVADHSLLPLSELVVVDNMPWFGPETPGIGVADLAKDLQTGRRLRILYRSSAEPGASWRTVDPYGLLAKAGRWYLVADINRAPRLYSIKRLQSWEVLPAARSLRQGESLASLSRHLSAAVENRNGITVAETLAVDRLDLAQRILGSRLTSSNPLDAGRVEITIVYDQVEAACQLLQFGAHLRVTSPPEVQAVMRDIATATAALYQG